MKIGKKRPAPLSSDSMAIMREKARRQGYAFIPYKRSECKVKDVEITAPMINS